MKNALVFVLVALTGAPVFAQEIAAPASSRPVVEKALELSLGAGYAQGFGDIGQAQRSLTDQQSAGGEVTLGVGYRMTPRFLIGVYGSGGKYATQDLTSGADIWTATAGLQANVHLLPDADWDPWIGLGTGWRGYWVSRSGGTDSRHGWDLARLQAGVDYRVSPALAVSPYVGAGLTTFLAQELAGEPSFANVAGPDVNVWVFAGLQGRFDLFGGGRPSMRLAAAR